MVTRLACCLLGLGAASTLAAQVSLSISVGPPPIPYYEQPVCPEDGYTWTPGYWGWGPNGYFWVPGTWVMAPEIGLLWTPGYWGWSGGSAMFHDGYWGSHVGFYGGINYGYGYNGSGFQGGYWQGRNFYYNRAVTNVSNTHITNVYNQPVPRNNSHVAYNGGAGGVRAVPNQRDRAAEREHHVQPTPVQNQHHQSAGQNRDLLVSVNRGKPPVAATPRPGDFAHAMPAKGPGGRIPEATLKATPQTHGPEARPSRTEPQQARPGRAAAEAPRPGRPAAETPRPGRPAAEAPRPVSRPRDLPTERPAPNRPQPIPTRQPDPRRDPGRDPRPQRQPDPPHQSRPEPSRAPMPPRQAEPPRQSRPEPPRQAEPPRQNRPEPPRQNRPEPPHQGGEPHGRPAPQQREKEDHH
jgi:hypothetical protein